MYIFYIFSSQNGYSLTYGGATVVAQRFFFALGLVLACMLVRFITRQSSVQHVIPAATGSKTGSYFRFVSQAATVCSKDAKLEVRESAGSTANLDAMEANEVAVAVSQLDILDLYKRTKDMSGIKLLVPLFPEQVHFVTRADVTKVTDQKTFLGITVPRTGTAVQLQSVSDLAGVKVAAAGGSFKTAQVISYLGGISMDLKEVGSADKAIAGLMSGQYDAAILVGAQPLGSITAMGEGWQTFACCPSERSWLLSWPRSTRRLSP